MQHGRTHEPEHDLEPVAREQPYARVPGERERTAEQQQLERAADDEARSDEGAAHQRSPNVIRATHLVFSTPGAAGTMIRAG
ncbi:hypothetical protein SSP24_01410 [Streptomyces spinoverrucosus]|uniref:Uncharacterized protein n=1 Tax=Streptomyces spinoverrucosus TaxID=284043 RepID=A0A4Y3VBW7_9ACTN|nr:hypothetical protein SSP24_01410 [Streptomyces spinoverrucosus]GHB42681.1 hypothetical protein GCM10010397_11180 [Streptomyces spinoverrucosus]